MAITLLTLLAKLGLDSGGFVDGMDKAAEKADKGSLNITKSLSKIGFDILKVGAVAGAAAITGLAVALGSTIGPASELNETISKVGIVFGEEADRILAFGKTAASSLGMSENAALAAAGTYGNLFRAMELSEEASADMSLGLVQLAGDLASFNNMNPEEALNALRSGLSGETEPLKRLGININQAIIEAKALELGLMGVDDELTAGIKAQAVYALAMEQTTLAQGDAAKTIGQFAGQQRVLAATMEDLKAKIGSAILPAINAFMTVINGIVNSPGFQVWLEKAIDTLSAVAATVVDVIGLLVKGDIAGALTEMFGSDTATKILSFTDAIGGFIKQIATFVSTHAEAFKGALIAIAALLGGAMLVSGITSVVALIGTIASPIGLIVAAVALLGAAWAGNWGGIQEKTQAVIDWIVPLINGAITAITEWWAANGATLIGTVTATWDWIKGLFQSAVDIIQPIVEGALTAISAWWTVWGGSVMSAVQNTWDFIVKAFQTYFEVVRKVVETVWGVIQQLWEAYGDKILQGITNVWEIIKTVFGTAFTFIKTLFEAFVLLFNGDLEGFAMKVTEAFTGLWEGIVKIVTLAWENIQLVAVVAMDLLNKALTIAWDFIKKIFTDAWDAIVLFITNSWEAFRVAVATIINGVVTFFTDTDWASVGMNLIGGIVKGVTDAAGWLWDTVTGLLSGLLDKIKEFFGIASPSKLMAAQIGEPLVQGIGEGMKKAMRLMESAELPDITASLVGVPSGQVAAAGGDMQGGGNVYNLTINTTERVDTMQSLELMRAWGG